MSRCKLDGNYLSYSLWLFDFFKNVRPLIIKEKKYQKVSNLKNEKEDDNEKCETKSFYRPFSKYP